MYDETFDFSDPAALMFIYNACRIIMDNHEIVQSSCTPRTPPARTHASSR